MDNKKCLEVLYFLYKIFYLLCIQLKILKNDLCYVIQWSVFCQSNNLILLFCYTFCCIEFYSYILFKNIIAVLFFYLLPPSDSPIYSIIQFRLSFLSYIHMRFYVSMQALESTDERKKCDACLLETEWICLMWLSPGTSIFFSCRRCISFWLKKFPLCIWTTFSSSVPLCWTSKLV